MVNSPLLYGPYYNTPALAATGVKKYYSKVDGKYVVTGSSASSTVYESSMKTFFRECTAVIRGMWPSIKAGVQLKESRSGLENGEEVVLIKPRFTENLRFFLTYQLGTYVFQVFYVEFCRPAERCSGAWQLFNGNWVSGIGAFDNPRTGPRDKCLHL
jgi:hypothetical protein